MSDEIALPRDEAAEANILGAMLLSASAAKFGVGLDSKIFYAPKHEKIHKIMVDLYGEGEPVDPLTVNAAIMQRGIAQQCGGPTYLHDLISGVYSPAIIETAAKIVKDRAQLRRLVIACKRGMQRAGTPGDDSSISVAAEIAAEMTAVRDMGQTETFPTLSWAEIADQPPGYDWLVPGLIERNDRMIFTGAEGAGKSMLARQLGVTLASGLHPFKLTKIEPMRVLMIDAENTKAQSHRAIHKMIKAANVHPNARIKQENFELHLRTTGMTLSEPEDASWLLRLCESFKPDVICMGPLYHLIVDVDSNDERSMSRVAQTFRQAQQINQSALIIETHSPHASAGFKRSVRPIGSSFWLRWPEFGYGLRLAEDLGEEAELLRIMDFVPWRGARDQRDWPKQIMQSSNGFPWAEARTGGSTGAYAV